MKSGSLCPPLEASVLMPPQGNSEGNKTHPRSLECNGRQIVQTQTSDPDRVVPSTARPFCNPVQPQISQVCVTSTGSDNLGSRHLEPPMGESGCLRVSTSLTSQQGSIQSDAPGLSQNGTDYTSVVQHALVLVPGHSVSADSVHAPTAAGSSDTALQRLLPRPQEPEPTCLAPRASVIQEQGFSDEVATRIEASQGLSTRAVYRSKCAIFVKWCKSNKVDFRSPSETQIAEFLL